MRESISVYNGKIIEHNRADALKVKRFSHGNAEKFRGRIRMMYKKKRNEMEMFRLAFSFRVVVRFFFGGKNVRCVK